MNKAQKKMAAEIKYMTEVETVNYKYINPHL